MILVTVRILLSFFARGLIDFQEPVSKYWPEFGQNGKEKVTVEQLLSHQVDKSF